MQVTKAYSNKIFRFSDFDFYSIIGRSPLKWNKKAKRNSQSDFKCLSDTQDWTCIFSEGRRQFNSVPNNPH